MKYDYLVVGSGLYGAVFAREAADRGKKVLVIDKRPNVAGNIYTEKVEGIHVHKYGAHIFHTNDTKVWKYITRFAEFNRFTNSPVANYRGELYSLPFNMYTFNKMWGVVTPEEAAAKIEEQKKEALKVFYLKSKEDKFMLPIFTDTVEFSKLNREGKYRAMMIDFKNIKKIIMPEALGMVINPYGFNLVVQLQHFDNLLARFGMSAE